MSSPTDNWYLNYLICPDCGAGLVFEHNIKCLNCDFNKSINKPIDLRPTKPMLKDLTLDIVENNSPNNILSNIDIEPPIVTYSGPAALRDSRELMSEIINYVERDSCVLDLGCGPRDQAIPIQYLEYKYVGIDISNKAADILADAHAIPFHNESFDCVFSYAVLEHLYNPFVVINEVQRVLKPGGIYIGTVSQGEPFHNSYFHHTPWGIVSLVSSTKGMKIIRMWASRSTLKSLAVMGSYPKIIKFILHIVDKIHISNPYLAPRRMQWSKKKKMLDEMYSAGSICFIVQKSETF